jgi:tetratricopeptide (TPR) repeat protein
MLLWLFTLFCGGKEPSRPEDDVLDYFKFSFISSPQRVGIPFSVAIEAINQYGDRVSSFNENVNISDLTSTLTPPAVRFNAGLWADSLTVMQALANDTIIAIYNGFEGRSNGFVVHNTVTEAWELFEKGGFLDASEKFTEAITQNEEWADAYNGRGWCLLELRDLEEASADFAHAIQFSGSLMQVANEARTGQSSVWSASHDYEAAAEATQAVIDSDPSFQFSHRESIDIDDVRLTLSTALVGLARDAESPSAVDSLFDEIAVHLNAVDGENLVLREDPTTWRLGDERYVSFEEAILEKLEWLISVYSG